MKEATQSSGASQGETLPPGHVLNHPMRVRILEVANERPISPIRFLNLGLAPELDTSQKSLSHVSYHFRQLEKAGCLEIVERVPRRGATEHVYRGRARAFFNDEEWAELTPRERRLITRTMYQGLAARAESAMLSDTFDSRTDRHLTWIAMEVDERGWKELMGALWETYEKVDQIRHGARDRLATSADEVIPVTIGMLGFESPPPPPLP